MKCSELIKQKLQEKEYEYLCFDFFDTLVHRDCNSEEVLYEWSKCIAADLEFVASPSIIYDLRKETENSLKRNGVEEVAYTCLLTKIYEKLKKKYLISLSSEEFVNLSKLEETRIEQSHIYIEPSTVNFLDSIKNEIKLIIISDYYMSHDLVEKILNVYSINCLFKKIYISSDYHLRKSTGSLYKYVLKDLKISSDKMLMIGDNIKSDYKIPMAMGIDAVHIDNNNNYYINSLRDIKHNYLSLYKNYKVNPLAGYIPEIIYFISKLYSELKKKDIKIVFFCSREGQLIKKLFDEYQATLFPNNTIRTEYLYVSRRSTLLPSLKRFDEEDFHNIFRQFHELKLEDFLSSIGFSSEEINGICTNIPIDKTSLIDSNFNNKTRDKLSKCSKFIKLYNEKREYQKDLFIEYLKNNIVAYKDAITIVDIGWKGTIQDNINNLLPEGSKLQGFYYGLRLKEYKTSNYGSKFGIMFSDYPSFSLNYSLYSRNFMFWERIFAADHGPVLGYCKENGIVKPVINNSDKELQLYNYIFPFQNKMYDSYKLILKDYGKSKWTPYELEDLLLESQLQLNCRFFPKIWAVEKNARDFSKENFGNVSKNSIKQVVKIGNEQINKKDFFFVDYSYRVLDKFHLHIFYPFAHLYCNIVYLIKRRFYKK